MCRRNASGPVAVSVISTQQSIAAGATLTIPQRGGRVRLVVSVQSAGTLDVYRDAASAGNILASVTNPGRPVVFDWEHWGPLVQNKIVIKNPTGGALVAEIAEHVEPQ